MNLLIVVHHRFELWRAPAWFSQRLTEEFSELAIVHRDSYEGLGTNLREAEIIFTISLRPEQFLACKKLRWIHTPTAAVHQFLFPELVNSDVVLTNSTEVHGPVVAEQVIALIFALAKKIPQAAALQHKHEWGKEAIWSKGAHPKEICGAILGLVGLGSIGRRVSRMAAALGMHVLAVREHVEKAKPEGVDAVYSSSQLDEVLRQSDFVVLAAPLTGETTKLMDARRLAIMKPDSYLINVGRGPQVDETALAEALRTHRIAGAALDVFEQEPLPADSPLWDIENLLITPHTAGITDKLWQRHYENFSGNLRRYLARQPLEHVVDKQKGY
jgi:phosphoglycerate dehydrogenase-like enzyme